MIAVDTNVLLRYLLQDDQAQSPKATNIFMGNENILITDVVLVETIWTLKGKKYKLPKHGLVSVVEHLFQEPNVEFENSQTVWSALQVYRGVAPDKHVDFADTLILEKAIHVSRGSSETFNGLYTFDADLQKLAHTQIP